MHTLTFTVSRIFWGRGEGWGIEPTVHELNSKSCIPLRHDVLERVWISGDVSYDYMHIFTCKAIVMFPLYEQCSNLMLYSWGLWEWTSHLQDIILAIMCTCTIKGFVTYKKYQILLLIDLPCWCTQMNKRAQ